MLSRTRIAVPIFRDGDNLDFVAHADEDFHAYVWSCWLITVHFHEKPSESTLGSRIGLLLVLAKVEERAEPSRVRAAMGRSLNGPTRAPGQDVNIPREISRDGQQNMPNREFPPPGKASTFLLKQGSFLDGYFAVDDGPDPQPFETSWKQNGSGPVVHGKSRVLVEMLALMFLIETLKPLRIVSVHAKRPRAETALKAINENRGAIDKVEKAVVGKNTPGIFVDPRYSFSPKRRATKSPETDKGIDDQKFNINLDPSYPDHAPPKGQSKTTFSARNAKEGVQDDQLCLRIAKQVAAEAAAIQPRSPNVRVRWSEFTPYLVMGNHLHLDVPAVHYAFEPVPERILGFLGFSLGDWGPVTVEKSANEGYSHDGSRLGAPVYTVETFGYGHSGAFLRTDKGWNQLLNAQGLPLNPAKPPSQFDPVRCRQLQAYAEGLRKVFLEDS